MKKLLLIFFLLLCFIYQAHGAISAYKGIYSGIISGGFEGTIIASVEENGDVYLVWHSTKSNQMDVSRSSDVKTDGSYSGVSELGRKPIEGQFTTGGAFSGTWSTGSSSPVGIFAATKQFDNTKYAGTYEGTLSGEASGTWTMTADFTGVVTGNGTLAGIGKFNLEGAVDDVGQLVFSVFNEDISGSGNLIGRLVSGKWFDDNITGGYGGTFSGKRTFQPVLEHVYYLPVFKPPFDYWSGLGITNLSKLNSASVVVNIYNQTGTIRGTETKDIPVGGQDSFLIGTTLSENGWIKVSSTQKVSGMNFLGQYKGYNKDYYIADVPFTDTLSVLLLIPHVAQNDIWDTTIFIVNPSDSEANVTSIYTNKSGTSSTPYVVSIPAYGSIDIPVSTIGNSTSIKGGYVSISSSQGLTAFALYNNLKTGNYSNAGINAVDNFVINTSYVYYLPVFKPKPGHWSGLGITNLNTTSVANIDVTIYSQDGDVLDTESKILPANGQDAFSVGLYLADDGWIKVSSDQPLAGLNFLGEYEGKNKYYLGDVPFTNKLSKSMVIPHVAQNTIWDTNVYLANPNTSEASVNLTYTDKSGASSTPYLVSIPANGSTDVPVSTIGSSTSIKGGYVTISSNQGLTAFALYNNLKTGNYSYAGINAVDLSQ